MRIAIGGRILFTPVLLGRRSFVSPVRIPDAVILLKQKVLELVTPISLQAMSLSEPYPWKAYFGGKDGRCSICDHRRTCGSVRFTHCEMTPILQRLESIPNNHALRSLVLRCNAR